LGLGFGGAVKMEMVAFLGGALSSRWKLWEIVASWAINQAGVVGGWVLSILAGTLVSFRRVSCVVALKMQQSCRNKLHKPPAPT